MRRSRPSSTRWTRLTRSCSMSWSDSSSRAGDRKMERESLLTVLMILLGGVALQVIGAWLSTFRSRSEPGLELERAAWLRLWRPLVPAVVVAAWLCGWALSEPDPVPDRVGPLVFIVCAPFVLIGAHAIVRAALSLLGSPDQFGIATVGLIRPY